MALQTPSQNFANGGLKNKNNGPFYKPLILCVLLSVVMMVLSGTEGSPGPMSYVRNGVEIVATPFRYLGALASQPFSGLGNIFGNLTASEATLSELREENARLTAENAELKESSLTAANLEALLELKNTYSLQTTGARVISGSTSTWESTITIDKGSTSGLEVGMPVTDAYGVIGQISECNATTSVVRLITDERSGVSAMIQSTRAQGQLTGSADGTLYLTLVRTDQNVAVGDIVVTSGLGGTYPKGLPLGTVTSVEKPTGAQYYTIVVKPVSLTSNFEEVLVITSLTEEQKPTEEEAALADGQEKGTLTPETATTDTTGDATASGSGDGDDETDDASSSSSTTSNQTSGTSGSSDNG
jgi:rod shape-determining protein MreC